MGQEADEKLQKAALTTTANLMSKDAAVCV